MALYAYRCDNDHDHDAQVAVDERDTPRTCPTCSQPARKVISLYGAFRFGRDGFLVSPNENRRRPHTV